MPKAPKTLPELEITDEQREEAEAEIREKQKVVDYDTKEYPVEVLVDKYRDGLDEDTNELYIPDYQREMIWEESRQSKFIESILLGLPIPYIFVADLRPKEEDNVDDLARSHCVKSFEEVGRDKTANELLKIKNKVVRYLKQILQNIEQYLSNKEYLDLSTGGTT